MIDQQSPPIVSIGAGRGDQRWRVPAICLALAAITYAVFGQTLRHEFVNFDDDLYITDNPMVARGLTFKGLEWVFTHADCSIYHPLTMLSLMGDYQLHGLHAGGYHLTNILLHTASVLLLFLVLRQMTGALWRSAFVAAVFAIHPLRVESVAWVAERKDVLSAFFFMLTLGAYVRYAENLKSQISNFKFYYIAALFLFAMALLSKPTVVTLPFVLLLLDYWPLRRFEQPGKLPGLILEKIPLLALAAGACATTVLVAGQLIMPTAPLSMLSRVGNALIYYAVYLRQMFWPEGLAVPYPYPPDGWPPWEMALAGMMLAVLSAIAWRERRRRPWLLIGWLWYLGMLTPMIGIKPAGAFAQADRYTYLPQIGVYMAVTWLVADWRAGWLRHESWRAARGGLMAGVIVVLMICARKQTAFWQNSETLWAHTIACTKNNCLAHYNLGGALRQRGRLDEAILQYQEALRINPGYANALNNLGTALRQKGRLDEAITQFNLALKVMPDNEAIHFNLAKALFQKGRMDEAIIQFQAALQIEPADMEVQNNLAWLLATAPQASLRNGDRAVQLARQANALAGGGNPVILHTLAAAFAEAGRYSEAVETAQRALRLAAAQTDTVLAGQLQLEMNLYQTGSPFHSPAQTH